MGKKLQCLIGLIFVLTSIHSSYANLSSNTPPVLSNFRIESNDVDRIYFDSNEQITGSSVNGFDLKDVDGIRITAIHINDGQTTGHYFSVSSSFTWTHNNTLEYTGGSDLVNLASLPLGNFSLQYIQNNIPTPSVTGTEYYVDAGVNSSGDGLSESTAFRTIQEGVDKFSAGDKIWVKAGHYGSENVYVRKSGTVSQPLFMEGYKHSPGDITQNYYNYGNNNGNEFGGNALDPSEMPLLDGINKTSKGINIGEGSKYIYIKNFQVKNYEFGVAVSYYCNNLVLENIITKDMGKEWSSGTGIKFMADSYDTNYSRIINSVSINATEEGIALGGANSLIENTKVYCDQGNVVGDIGTPTDYYIRLRGRNNIIRNSLVNRLSRGHDGHGFSLKYSNEYTLIEKSEAVNVYWSFQARHSLTRYNVFRDNVARANVPYASSSSWTGGIHIMSGAHHNTFENMYIHDTSIAFSLERNSEDTANSSDIGNNNIFNNIIIDNMSNHVFVIKNWLSQSASFNNNKFNNLTVNNVGGSLFSIRVQYAGVTMSNNEMKNSIFKDVPNLFITGPLYRPLKSEEFSWESNNFHNSFTGQGNNAFDYETNFVNAQGGDFHLQEGSELIGAGVVIPGVSTDFEGFPRPIAGVDLGAYQSHTVLPGISDDVTICAGESTTLAAFGGTSYLWNNDDTASSIVVSPEETTTYSVTITNDEGTTDLSVTVTVIEPPTADAGEDVESCAGSDVELNATGGDTYEWSTGATTPNITVNPTETTTYTVSIKNNNCTTIAIDSVKVIIVAENNLSAGEDVEICSGSSVTLQASGSDNYMWNTGEDTESIEVSPTETTTYTVTTVQGDCTFTDEITITVSDASTVDAGEDVEICEGASVTLTATGNGDYTWSNGETGSEITVSPTETTTYTVSSTNTCNSNVITDEVTVTVNTLPKLSAGDDVHICKGSSVTLTASDADNYLWSNGETTQSITVEPTSSEIYYVTTTNGTCEVRDQVEVTVSNPPKVELGDDLEICLGAEITLQATGKGKFVWNTGEKGRRITVNPTVTTTYTVTASSNCTSEVVTDEITVTVLDGSNSTLSAGEDQVICEGSSITLTASGADSYIWSTGETTQSIEVSPTSKTTYSVTAEIGSCFSSDEVVVDVNKNTLNAGVDQIINEGSSTTLTATGADNYVWSTGETTQSINVSPASKTTYTVTTEVGSCTFSDEIIVDIKSATINAGVDQIICEGASTTLTATGADNYLWSTGETTPSINVSPTSITTYTVSTTVGSNTISDEVIVDVKIPAINAGQDQLICEGTSTTLTATEADNYLWSTGETTQSINVSPTNMTTYTVTTSVGSCSVSDEVIVDVINTSISAGDDVTIESGNSTTLTANGIGDYLWSTGETTQSITVSPTSEETIYTVTLTNAEGCTNSDDVAVFVTNPTNDEDNNNNNNNNNNEYGFAGPDQTICSQSSTIITASTGSVFLWSTGETTASITVNPEITTEYNVTISDGVNVMSDSVIITVDENCSGLGNRVSAKDVKIFPNPADDIINIELIGYREALDISLYNLNGSKVYSELIENYSSTKKLIKRINVSRFVKGVYFIRLINQGDILTKKILVI